MTLRSFNDLHDYQREAFEFGLANPRCYLGLGLGLGKTVIALSIAAFSQALEGDSPILIIAPLRVAKTVWKQEAAKWAHLRHLHFAIAVGDAAQRRQALNSRADVHVINIENLPWLIANYPRSKWRWRTLILDEISVFKGPSSARGMKLKFATLPRMSKDRKRITKPACVERIIALSATPASNGLSGLWGQIAILDGGERLGVSHQAYINSWFHYAPKDRQQRKPIPNPGAKDKIFDRLRDIFLAMRTRDYIDMPDLVYVEHPVVLPPDARGQYDELETEFLLELPDLPDIEAVNSGVLSNKLLQMAGGFPYVGEAPEKPDPDRPYHCMHTAKIDALREIINVSEGNENLLIGYWFNSERKELEKAFPNGVFLTKENEDEVLAAFDRGEIGQLFVQIASVSHGLNLQKNCHVVVFYSLVWSLEIYRQFIGRVFRQGQTESVSVHSIVVKNSIEQRLLRGLTEKDATQEELLKALSPAESTGAR